MAAAQALEEQRFGRYVRVVRSVEIQMLVGDVGDHSNVEVASDHAVLRQPVRGGFQHTVFAASSDHPRQIGLHIGSIRGGRVQARAAALLAEKRTDGTDHARPVPGGSEHGVDEICHRRLAISSGDTDHLQTTGRVAMPGGRQVRQRFAAVADANVGKERK